MNDSTAEEHDLNQLLILEDPPQANLVSLFLKGLLEQNLGQPRLAHKAKKMVGQFLIRAGQMEVTLRFEGGVVRIISGSTSTPPSAHVEASLEDLIAMVVQGKMVTPVLLRRIRVGGNLWRLLKLLPLMRIYRTRD
jgi:hypothetical protein